MQGAIWYSSISIMPFEAKPLAWIATSLKDLNSFPDEVKQEVGYALFEAQKGGKHVSAKPLKGYRGAGVLEVVSNDDGDTYRAVYTVRFTEVVYVLHCFQKKSKSGIGTPQQDIDLINKRLKVAEESYRKWLEQKK